MFDSRRYFEVYNMPVRESFKKAVAQVEEIKANYTSQDYPKGYFELVQAVADKILYFVGLEAEISDDYFVEKDFDELKKQNYSFYEELLGDNYAKSYANPSYCVEVFGDKFGQLMSYFYMAYRQFITYSFMHKIYEMNELCLHFIDVNEYLLGKDLDYDHLEKLITKIERKDKVMERVIGWKQYFDPKFRFYTDTVVDSDLDDLRYLFKYNAYITENEIKIAEFLKDYPQDKIEKLADMTVKAYLRGFERDNKSLEGKTTVTLMFNAGMERIARAVIQKLKGVNLDAIINNVATKQANKQYGYDHRFDTSLFLDEEFVNKAKREAEIAAESVKSLMQDCSGIIYFGQFGEKPFEPVNKKETLKLSPQQQKLFQVHQNYQMQIQNKYYSREERSFTAISFPSPEIGDNFEEIFEDILEINMLDSLSYEAIQQKIIDVLDLADSVIIRGKDGNETNMKVMMQEIANPNLQTNFVNCGADVNIPVGEVFTSPRLAGTEGTLHIDETYLAGLKFENLKLHFKDGYIADYSCTNFADDDANKNYVQENLLMPHDSLPIGEFAIGTNTLAYTLSRKHNILDVLPVLIIEKMGPHFAIGDTCFTFAEDRPVFNPNKKEVIARDNERSIRRKENPSEAYTFKHIDITLPYDSLDYISIVTKCGKQLDIIRNGRFVLQGTEILNEPLESR